MLMKTALTALLGLAMVTDAAIVPNTDFSSLEQRQNRNGRFGGNRNQGGNTGTNANKGSNNQQANTCLAPGAIQTGSASTGQSSAGAADGQVNSKTCVKGNIMNSAMFSLTLQQRQSQLHQLL